MNKRIKNNNPEYTYKKKEITIDKNSNEYPVIEKTMNGLVFPEKIKDNMDIDENEDD